VSDIYEMGPIDYLCVEFPPGSRTGEGLPYLVDLVDRRIIRILDLRFLRKNPDGSVVQLDGEQVGDGLALFSGAASGMLGNDDLEDAATALEPGSAAAIVVYENLWAAPLAVTLRKAGAQVVAGGRIPVQALLAALDASEPDYVEVPDYVPTTGKG
jgi:hypothetical protein